MRKIISFLLAITMLSCLCIPAFATDSNTSDDINTAETIYLVQNEDGLYEVAPTYSIRTRSINQNVIEANKVFDGVYTSGDNHYVKCDATHFSIATKISVDMSSPENVQRSTSPYELNEAIQAKLMEVSETAQEYGYTDCSAEVYSADDWVEGYMDREYKVEYATTTGSTEFVPVIDGIDPSVLKEAAVFAIGTLTKTGDFITVASMLSRLYKNGVTNGSKNCVLQFCGDWTVVYKFTSIKGVGLSETQGVPNAALMRSIEGYGQVDHYQFNLYNPDEKPANDVSDPTSTKPAYTDNYKSDLACQKICYERRLMSKELDNSVTYLLAGTKSTTTKIGV